MEYGDCLAGFAVSSIASRAWYVEYLTPAAYIEDLVVEKFELDEEGFLTIPNGPGLGIELIEMPWQDSAAPS